jgi:hypothetical protein
MEYGYAIVYLGGFKDRTFSTQTLQWAQKCQADAYLKSAQWIGED